MERVERRHRDAEPTLAGRPRPAGAISTTDGGPAWLNALRPAGNRALSGVIARVAQRQEAPVAEPEADDLAPAEEAPLLDETQVADARRYYTVQPWLYTPAIIAQLRGALGLGEEGGVDDALVLAVAEWQSTEGAGDPALAIDGKAGPRTLPRIFRGGLNVEGEGEAFGGEVQAEVIDEWATLATAEARRDRLVELVNARLADAGVPATTPAFDTNVNNAGSFDFPTWRMLIGRGRLGADSISEEDAREVADTVYHEARHTEQWFRMAQLRAAQGLSAAAITTELGIPARIAREARANPLVRGSMEAVIAQGWWDSVYGGGSAHREAVLTEIDRAATARTRAQTRFDGDPTAANQAALDRANERFDRAFAAYQNLPEENDAWATGPAAAAGITGGSPEPEAEAEPEPAGGEPEAEPEPAEGAAEGPTPILGGEAGEPAGAPPAAGRPSHEILPEESLP
jgi:hypothetical protein